jgi:hypothetical protein
MISRKSIIIAACILAVIPTIFVMRKKSATPESGQDEQITPATNLNAQNAQAASEDIAAPIQGVNDIKAFAGTFASQFGSYSNQSGFENISELMPFMTESFAAWAQTYIIDQQAKNPKSSVYSGVITRTLNTEIKDYTLGATTVTAIVTTQREKTSAGKTEIIYQPITLTLVKSENGWKVDNAKWQ